MNRHVPSRLGIIGVGRLGLCYALSFAHAGFDIIASSYKQDYVTNLSSGRFDSSEPGVNDLYRQTKNIRYTHSNQEVISWADHIYVMVATPSLPDGSYDTSAVWEVVSDFQMSASVVEHKTLIIGSTVNPGDCELFQQALEDQKVHVVYCPTFIAQGSVLRDIRQPHSLLIGTQDQLQFDRCKAIFERLVSADTPIFQMHTTAAEISKIAANCRSTMEIVYFNLIGRILVNSGLDEEIGEVNDFLNLSKKSVRWRSGFGYGGPCYPRDNRAFVQYTKKLDYEYELGSFIDQSNQQQVQFLFDYFVTLNKKKLPFFFDHISYKPNVAIFEESQPLQLAEKLLSYGYPVYIKQSEFLTRDIEISLSKKWGDQLTFISPEQLESNHVALFHIEFESLWRKTANNEIIEENVRPEE